MMVEEALKRLSKTADEAEIFHLRTRTFTVKTKRYGIDLFKENSSEGYGIRVLKNHRMGFYFSNRLDGDALEMAVKVAGSAEEDRHHALPGEQRYLDRDQPLFEMDVEEGIKMAGELVGACRDHKGVDPTAGALSWSTSQTTVANTKGLYAVKKEASISAYLSTVAKNGGPSTGFHFQVSRRKDIDPLEVAGEACRLALSSLNPARLEAGEMPVILRPMAVAELFEYALIPSFSADNVQRGRSKLQGMVDEEVFSDVTIVDDPTMEGGLMSEPFDDEGVASKRTVLVEKGILRGFLYDMYTAAKEGCESTGNGVRASHSSLPQVGPSNFIVTGGQRIESEEEALVVHGLIGAHTSNPISGDFSCETRNAYLNGRPVKKAIISGNIFTILQGGVGFGSDVRQYSAVVSPSIWLPPLSVSG
ncbi:MAG: TldD/PmbA family protein [Methanobacteriota archaeon]|nr:MAG: TldD/PmbA family protein [Euryarchaeota archaeon]